MKRLFLVVLLAIAAWQLLGHHASRKTVDAPPPGLAARPARETPAAPRERQTPAAAAFHCDGRTYCSQMTSCAEATFFLKNCPGAKMDGNHDGVPCESQWCRP